MLSIYNDPSHVLTGRSTHNERVERLWRDVTRCVSSSFIDTFNVLEAENVLDPGNEVDIFCLHYAFLPHINKCLVDFCGSWNYHPLSTEGNMSPLQLFVEGVGESGELEGPQQPPCSDPSGASSEQVETVEVPAKKFIPCSQLLTQLKSSVDPISQCSDFGKEFYYRSIQLVGHHLQAGCSNCHLN